MKNGSTKKSGKRKGESKGSGGRDILNSLDKVLNTPTATKHLLEGWYLSSLESGNQHITYLLDFFL